jgi:hypothetical protein
MIGNHRYNVSKASSRGEPAALAFEDFENDGEREFLHEGDHPDPALPMNAYSEKVPKPRSTRSSRCSRLSTTRTCASTAGATKVNVMNVMPVLSVHNAFDVLVDQGTVHIAGRATSFRI